MTPERFERFTSVLNNRQPDITVVLENVFDPHNVSAVMRTCDAIGIQDVYILNDRIAPHKKWGYRSSSTATEWISVHQFINAEECFAKLWERYERIYASYLTNEAQDLYSIDFTGSLALVFGNETFGVSENIRKLCDAEFMIPQVGIIKSLNISVACAVTLYEAFRCKRAAGHYDQLRISIEQETELRKKWGIE